MIQIRPHGQPRFGALSSQVIRNNQIAAEYGKKTYPFKEALKALEEATDKFNKTQDPGEKETAQALQHVLAHALETLPSQYFWNCHQELGQSPFVIEADSPIGQALSKRYVTEFRKG